MDSLNTTSYSREEVAEARAGLRLLKERMANLGMSKRKGTTESGHRERSFYNNSYASGPGSVGGGSNYNMPHIQGALPPQRRSQHGNVSHTQSANKPPMMPSSVQYNGGNDVMNTSSLSGMGNSGYNAMNKGYGGPNGSTPRGMGNGGAQNYRRAFKPQLTPAGNASQSMAFSTLNSEDRTGGMPGQTHNQFYENPVVNRQSLNNKMFNNDLGNRPPQTFYEPSRRSPGMARRQISRDNDPSNSAASTNSRALQYQNSVNGDKQSETRNGFAGLGYQSNSQKRIPTHMTAGVTAGGPNQRQYPQNGYGNVQNDAPSYDSRKYSGMPDRSAPNQQYGGYKQPSPLKNLKQSMNQMPRAAEADPFNQNSKPRMQHTPPKGKPSPMNMKSQPKQFPQAQQNSYQYEQEYNPSPPKQIGGPSDPEYVQESNDRVPCSYCGRKFNPDSIEKHERICAKQQDQKRKVFDTKEKRQVDAPEKTTMNEFSKPFGLKKGGTKRSTQANTNSHASDNQPVNQKKMPKWKIQSLQFRQAMMAQSGNDTSAPKGNFRPTQEMSALNEIADDRIQCKWCHRKFNQEAGERHFKHCEDQYKKNLMKNGGKQPTKRGTQVGFMKKKY